LGLYLLRQTFNITMSSIPPTDFKQAYFKLDAGTLADESKREPFDIIIIGSGFGGGVLAGDLFNKNIQLAAQESSITADSTAQDRPQSLYLSGVITALANAAQSQGSQKDDEMKHKARELCEKIQGSTRRGGSASDIESILEDIVSFITDIQGPLIAQVIRAYAMDQFCPRSRPPSEKPKKILVVERGGLVFHSHSMNGPHPAHIAAAQANDVFFKTFRSQFNLDPARGEKTWSGGPLYTLGGRSTVWGLFAPRYTSCRLEFCDRRLREFCQDCGRHIARPFS
jgi:hypothetical protein